MNQGNVTALLKIQPNAIFIKMLSAVIFFSLFSISVLWTFVCVFPNKNDVTSISLMCKLKCKLTLASDAATIRPNDEANEGGAAPSFQKAFIPPKAPFSFKCVPVAKKEKWNTHVRVDRAWV